MIGKLNKKETLSDRIAGILTTTPGNFDPEDDVHEETRARVVENDADSETEEVGLSHFRKQNVDLLEDVDKKYVGKKASRKSLRDSDEWETEDEGLSTDEGEALDGIPGTRQIQSSDEDEDSEDNEYEDSSEEDGSIDDDENEDYGEKELLDNSNFKHMSDTNVSGQVKKGNSVRNQLSIWENLLEIRIQLQKCLLTSNKFPQHDTFKEFKSEADFKSKLTETKKNIANTLDKFLTLQLLLLKQFPETKTFLKQSKREEKQESDEEIPSDTEDEEKSNSEEESEAEAVPKKRKKLSDFEQDIKTRHEKYKDYRNSVIQKWNEKTRLTVAKSNTVSNTVLQQIDYILADKPKLIRRTQLKRSEYEVVGKTKTENTKSDEQNQTSKLPDEYDPEIYDDDDFYHQLLRELIEFKSADVTDPVQMSRQWIVLQNMRSKMKRKIDTKATKGRKIRFAIHSKLVNFMAPIDNNLWTEEAKNELYSSLFGSRLPKKALV